MKTLLIGFGHKARRGKDTVAQTIVEHYGTGTQTIKHYAFADALKREAVHAFLLPDDDYWAMLETARKQPIESFMQRLKVANDGCWLWDGKLNEKGYGIVYTPAVENYRAHRFMWEQVLGNEPVPLLRHVCDVPNCVNPLHLEPGTKADNSSDMVKRLRSANGERHSQAKLSDADVKAIRARVALDESYTSVGVSYGVTSSTVSRIVNDQSRINDTYYPDETKIDTMFSRDWLTEQHKLKFRNLLQHYGTEYRRAQDPFYWVKRLAATIHIERPDVALISDMRFPNEALWVRGMGGITVKVERIGYADVSINQVHSSETALDLFEFDYTILAPDGDLAELKRDAVALYDIIRESLNPPPMEDVVELEPASLHPDFRVK